MIIKNLLPDSFLEKLDNYLVKYLAYSNYRNYSNCLGLKENNKVLEIGSGIGNLSRFLIQKIPKGKLTCIDFSKENITKARKNLRKFKNIEFIVGDILNFEKKNYFDSIIINYVLHDIYQKEKAVKIIKNFLKPKGMVYIREPTRKNHGISQDEIKTLMQKENFSEITSKEGSSFPLKGEIFEGVFIKPL